MAPKSLAANFRPCWTRTAQAEYVASTEQAILYCLVRTYPPFRAVAALARSDSLRTKGDSVEVFDEVCAVNWMIEWPSRTEQVWHIGALPLPIQTGLTSWTFGRNNRPSFGFPTPQMLTRGSKVLEETKRKKGVLLRISGGFLAFSMQDGLCRTGLFRVRMILPMLFVFGKLFVQEKQKPRRTAVSRTHATLSPTCSAQTCAHVPLPSDDSARSSMPIVREFLGHQPQPLLNPCRVTQTTHDDGRRPQYSV